MDVLVTVVVTCTVAVSNLVYGVAFGLILSCLMFAWTSLFFLFSENDESPRTMSDFCLECMHQTSNLA